MKQTITEPMFIEAFHRCGRGEQFSQAGLCALFAALEEEERDTGEEMELDPIAFCCAFTEYDSFLEAARDYGQEFGSGEEQEALEWLEERTPVLETESGSIVIQSF